MKSLAIGCSLLALVACSSAPPFVVPSSTGSSTGGSSTAGANGTTAGTTGSSTGPMTSSGSSAGSSTGHMSSTGSSTGGSSTGGRGTTTGSYIGLSCTYNNVTGADSCEPYGYECTASYDTTDPATCILPGDQRACLSYVGCQDGGKPELACTAGFTNSGKNIDICGYPCKTTSNCASVLEFCLAGPDICFDNYCDRNASGAFKGPFNNRCTVDDGGDTGQCLSFGKGAVAFCVQNGFDFTGEACNLDPTTDAFGDRMGAFSQCDFGDTCLGDFSSMGLYVADGGVCAPLSVDGGCPDGYDSFPFYPGADWSYCVQDCTGGGTCTVGACFTDSTTGMSFCLPTLP